VNLPTKTISKPAGWLWLLKVLLGVATAMVFLLSKKRWLIIATPAARPVTSLGCVDSLGSLDRLMQNASRLVARPGILSLRCLESFDRVVRNPFVARSGKDS
jgi:hypothetical protein